MIAGQVWDARTPMSRPDATWTEWLGGQQARPLRPGAGPIVEQLGRAFGADDLVAVPDEGAAWAAHHAGGVQVHFEGWLNDAKAHEPVGVIERVVDTGTGVAAHREWRLDATHQAGKRGRQMLRRTVDLYRAMGVNTVYVDASEVGRYVWASAGFDFASEDTRAAVLDSVRPMARRLGHELDDATLPHAWSLAMLGPTITAAQAKKAEDEDSEMLSELNFTGDSPLKLGKALLLSGDCDPWDGVMDLSHPKTPCAVRVEAYLRHQ